ncbi:MULTISPECIES: YkgJ family cysteine cluster protein [Desulfococcus]|jgi:Fe-S-cluster containining protein|uniref:YkgJ family cysteine cluster protein n=1 Tax=Desulfococcus multivorans DSM 2059 TaxID=1121405 RepID=S7VDS0_DESML|nr:YkgJ family cysteine cluster protein [Desulfococcus multivorans]AQV00665.1 zinc/iron-chelating domain-containing protein [Desulfococcus multivorans]EPR42593.1 protein of unknown function UPF0153 [Desulfococcus multivorans DSM 2059]MDX9817914.1 YkgJ family cysteine cluster protein [Desulfococcus multivorans]SKA18151.1 hypothetical protein SAMN02745446_03123 [Desulfococcus multivorans DSM 2059]
MSLNDIPCDAIFECIQCGECCNGFGGTFVTPADIAAIAGYIGAPAESFVRDYCRMSGSRPVIAQGPDGYCIFYRDRLCSIHPVKPRMCRAWPYIESVLKDPANWRMMAGSCPGMRADITDACILRCVREQIEMRGF